MNTDLKCCLKGVKTVKPSIPLCITSVLMIIGISMAGAASLDLAALQEAALGHSTEIRMLRIDEQKSMIDVSSAQAAMHPQISLQASGTYLANPMDAVEMTLPNMPPVTVMDAQEPQWYQFGIKVNQSLFTWGKLSRSVRLHRLLAETASLQRSLKEQEIRTRTAVLLHSLKHLRRMSEAAVQQHATALRLSEIIQESYEQGFVVEEEVITAQLQAAELNIAVHELRREQSMVLLELAELTGMQLQEEELRFPPDPPHRGMDLDLLLEAALSDKREPMEIMGVLEQVRATAEQISRGSLYWKPDIGLQIEAGCQGARFPFLESGWYDESGYSLNVTVALEVKLWDGGRAVQDIRTSRLEREAAEVSAEKTRKEITRELTDTYLKYTVLLSRMEYNRLKEQNFESRRAAAQRQYDAGAGSEADLLILQLESLGHALRSEQDALEAASAYFTMQFLTGES